MPIYSHISTRLKAIALVQDIVAASRRPLSHVQVTAIVNAVTEDLDVNVNSVADEVRLAASLASAVQAIQDEMKNSAPAVSGLTVLGSHIQTRHRRVIQS